MSDIKKQITLNVTGNQRTKKYNIQLTEVTDNYSNVINIGDKLYSQVEMVILFTVFI